MTFVLREREMVGSYGADRSEVEDRDRAHVHRSPRPAAGSSATSSRSSDVNEGVARVARGDTGGSRIVVDVRA